MSKRNLRDYLTPDERAVLDLLQAMDEQWSGMDDAIAATHMERFNAAASDIKTVLVERVVGRLFPGGLS